MRTRLTYRNDRERITLNVAVSASGCWEWQRSLTRQGYGRLRFNERETKAHRLAYELWVGLVPSGLELDHLCRNRKCCNPEHLEAVSHAENMARSPIAFGSVNAAKTHCKREHEFTPENTYNNGLGGRGCRACKRERRLASTFAAANLDPTGAAA